MACHRTNSFPPIRKNPAGYGNPKESDHYKRLRGIMNSTIDLSAPVHWFTPFLQANSYWSVNIFMLSTFEDQIMAIYWFVSLIFVVSNFTSFQQISSQQTIVKRHVMQVNIYNRDSLDWLLTRIVFVFV